MNGRPTSRTQVSPVVRIGPELVLALARQIPTLETDALARLLAANLPTRGTPVASP